MIPCKHTSLTLLPGEKDKLRCRHCHLTIDKNELGEGNCPECFDARGERNYDFEDLQPVESASTRYRCEGCGVIINCD